MCNYRLTDYEKIVIVVPARGGSKRIPYKNIYPLNGRPLLIYTLQAIFEADLNCSVYVSTDDYHISQEVLKYGFGSVIERPFELAADNASTESVLLHVLDTVNSNCFEWIMTLPPTNPLRKPQSIKEFANYVIEYPKQQDCLMSVTENRGDFWLKNNKGAMCRLFTSAPRRQQDREPLYAENSAIYISNITALRDTHSILGNVVNGKVMDEIEALDINTMNDIKIAECIIGQEL